MNTQEFFQSLVCVTLIGDAEEKSFFMTQETFAKNAKVLEKVESAPIYVCESDLDRIINRRFAGVVIGGKYLP